MGPDMSYLAPGPLAGEDDAEAGSCVAFKEAAGGVVVAIGLPFAE